MSNTITAIATTTANGKTYHTPVPIDVDDTVPLDDLDGAAFTVSSNTAAPSGGGVASARQLRALRKLNTTSQPTPRSHNRLVKKRKAERLNRRKGRRY